MLSPLPLQSIPDELWWISTLIAAITAIWLFITKVAFPRWATYQEREQEDEQKKQITALDQVIVLNQDLSQLAEKLIDIQVEQQNEYLAKLDKSLQRVIELLTRIDARSQVNTREWESVDLGVKQIMKELEELKMMIRTKGES